VLALWAAAAIPTGLVYGALHRHPPASVVLVLLAISGWHGSATTLGNAAGVPITGVTIDWFGWQGGMLAVASSARSSPWPAWPSGVRRPSLRRPDLA
jgi:hypothetical protein